MGNMADKQDTVTLKVSRNQVVARLDTATGYLHNIIIWLDGTLRPWPRHDNCTGRWTFDGQVFVHNDKVSGLVPTDQGASND